MLEQAPLIRLSVFAALLLGMMLLEWRWPRRRGPAWRRQRWPANGGIQLCNALLLRLLLPAGAVGVAAVYAERGWGLMQGQLSPITVLVSLLILDLAIYLQHVATHRIPLLWRLHRMHHSDLHLDATTALRFHPLEILLSMLWKAVVLAVLGAPVLAVLIFELLLNGAAVFNHANWRLSPRLDRWLRWLIVTPDMHRVHHSIERQEHDTNFGFSFPWWDRIFGTYRDQPEAGHTAMVIGLPTFRQRSAQSLPALLWQPWSRGG